MRKTLLITGLYLAVSAASAMASDIPIDQTGQKFMPDAVVIKAGDTLVFTNKDDVKHNINILSASGDADDKGVQAPGADIKQTFTTVGEYQVRCKIHPKMKMTVTVQ